MPRSRPSPILAVLLVAFSLFGCRSSQPEGGFGLGGRGDENLRIAVENNNFLDVTVYAMPDAGSSYRLGNVTGQTTANFTIERRQLGGAPALRIFVDPLGGARGFLSELVFPDRYASLFVHVAPNLERSYVVIR